MEEAAGDAPLPAHTHRHKAYDVYLLAPQPAPLPEEAPFASVGRLSHGKGMHLLVEALGQAVLIDSSAHFYGAGVEGDDYAVQLKQQAQPLGDRIRFMGFRRDVSQRLPAYRFMVSTSRYESLGRVVMEAWEAGLVPIVYGASGGAVEIVRKSGGGLIFDDWSAEGLARTLYAALKMSDDDRRAMSAAGRTWTERRLGLNEYRAALSGVLF
uniref:glycosyltransferase family 4 protein n=1 Tax=Pararhizobium sp. IMCC3301 TaxID=3067904 RepID=UPI00353193D4